MAEALCSYIEQDRPFLGICLGLQLLFEYSEENGPGKLYIPPFTMSVYCDISFCFQVCDLMPQRKKPCQIK